MYTGTPTCCPYQEEASVSPLLKLCHHAVDNVWLGRDDVYGVHVSLRGSPLLEALDVWARQANGLRQHRVQRTGDVEVENVIFLDHIVYELFAVLVDYEYLPLGGVSDGFVGDSRLGGGIRRRGWWSGWC
jgi:hypothetical protein